MAIQSDLYVSLPAGTEPSHREDTTEETPGGPGGGSPSCDQVGDCEWPGMASSTGVPCLRLGGAPSLQPPKGEAKGGVLRVDS